MAKVETVLAAVLGGIIQLGIVVWLVLTYPSLISEHTTIVLLTGITGGVSPCLAVFIGGKAKLGAGFTEALYWILLVYYLLELVSFWT